MSENGAGGKVIVRGREYPLPEKLSLGESVDVERVVSGGGQISLMAGMVWIALRRADPDTHPDVIWERVRELDLDDFDVIEADPPEAAAKKTRKTRAASGPRRSATSSE